MGIAFLKMDRSRVKWRIKLAQAFDSKVVSVATEESSQDEARAKKEARNGKWALFLLPFITVLREGVEAVVFVGGVSQTMSLDHAAQDAERIVSQGFSRY
jgi:high-affinity iron transporter